MEEVFKVASAIIASIGGAGVIILGLSSWLGKVWANKILENERMKHSEQLEKYKSELIKQLEYARSEIEKVTFISRVQFEKEFQIYVEIWEELFDLYITTYDLFPIFDKIPFDEDKKAEVMLQRYKDYCKNYNKFSKTHIKYAPFYSKDLYDKLNSFKELAHKQGVTFELYTLENAKMEYDVRRETRDNTKALQDTLAELQNDFREYLGSLRDITA